MNCHFRPLSIFRDSHIDRDLVTLLYFVIQVGSLFPNTSSDPWEQSFQRVDLPCGLDLVYPTQAGALTAVAIIAGTTSYQRSGNLYGSSKDIGLITSKIPALTEHGGRVNRIGHTRVVIEGSIVKQGFFSEYTQESLDFDTDEGLMMHIVEESLVAANEMSEDNIQKDLLNGAGVIRYSGDAASLAEITGDGTGYDELDYTTLLKLSIDLDNNKCPKDTKVITGSRNVDTKVINAARFMFVGSEMIPTFERMEDLHSERAFRSVETYAAAGNTVNGEVGSVGKFRIVVVPEMMRYYGVGAVVGANAQGFAETNGRYDVAPCLVVGSGAFTTIGFQTSGKNVKFKIIHKKPGIEMATSMDPYGEKGMWSIKWYYGSMLLRPEWIAVCYSVCED